MEKWIEDLLRAEPAETTAPYSLLCSGCRRPCSGDDAHVIPWWNIDRQDFLTTYRCGECWKSALDEARAKIMYTVIENLTRDGRDRSLDYKIK